MSLLIGQRPIERLSSADASDSRSFRKLMACSIVASISMGFALDIHPIASGLDPSFIYAFNYAAARGLNWGQEFISTYGPYGYLIHTVDVASFVEYKIVFNLLFAVAAGIAAAAYLQSVPGLRSVARVSLAIVLIYALSLQGNEYRWSVLFCLVFLMGLHARERRRNLATHALASLLAGFICLMKFSTGFGTVTTVLFGSVLVQRPLLAVYRLAVAVPAVAVGFLIGWTARGGTLGGIVAYLATGWEMSSGYSSAMSSAPHDWQIGVMSFMVWFALIIAWVVALRTRRSSLTLAGLAIPLFVAWKHSIVRQDNHVIHLVMFGFFVIVLLLAEAGPVWRWRSALPIAVVLLIPLTIPWLSTGTGGPNAVGILTKRLSSRLGFPGLNDLVGLSRVSVYREDLARVSESALRKSVLPESMRAVIGRSSVDVYPWEISYVPANGLSWVNRPVPASFNAYTPALDRLNAAFFESSGRPEYLIWHTDVGTNSIDGRYLLWDEPRTLRAIVNYYDMVMTDSSVLLLRARSQPRFAPPQPITTLTVPWNTWTPVPPTDGVILAEASFTRPLSIQVIRIIFREGPVSMSLRFSSGEEVTYRLVPDNMGGGLWVSPHPTTVDELRALFQGGLARRVIAVRFSGGLVSRLSPSIVVSWSQFKPLAVPDPAARSVPTHTFGRGHGL